MLEGDDLLIIRCHERHPQKGFAEAQRGITGIFIIGHEHLKDVEERKARQLALGEGKLSGEIRTRSTTLRPQAGNCVQMNELYPKSFTTHGRWRHGREGWQVCMGREICTATADQVTG